MDGPLALYRERLRGGSLRDDPAQRRAVEELQLLHVRLRGYEPARPRRVLRGLFGWGRERMEESSVPGLYMYGGVGRGKSMLMDLFFESASTEPRRRVHFHAFMQEVHGAIHAARGRGTDDPVRDVSEQVAAGATLLCFDEMQITDITDAMLVGRLFEALFARGTVVVATSNRHPQDLYKDGLKRELFVPFIALIEAHMQVHHLESGTDHRRGGAGPRWIVPADPAALDAVWGAAPAEPSEIAVGRRSLRLPALNGRTGRASFADLCGRPYGPADYLALAERLDRLLLDGVPRLGPDRTTEAVRFVTLIDTLYEAKTALWATADAEPDALYTEGPRAFEFQRTASRLAEMARDEWGG